jgi:2-hydroxychromene-2-carboxylate isomerase
MGQVIELTPRRRQRRACAAGAASDPLRAHFVFDLASPFTYLATERVERSFDAVVWTPACAPEPMAAAEHVRAAAEARAAALRMPLVWPERFPARVPATMRVAAYAADCGRGAAFTLAAGRLAFCGGFDLEDPEVIAEAAAAAGLGLRACLAAARDERRDRALAEAAAWVAACDGRLPGLRVGRLSFWGEERVAEAAAAARVLVG